MTIYRFQQKRGTSAQWAAWTQPLRDGEFGINKDNGEIKVGDGIKLWADLPVALGSQYLPLLGKAKDSYRLDGLASTDFLRSNGKAVDSDKLDGLDSTAFLSATGTAADAAKFGGQAPAFYMPASAAGSFLAALGKAADADKLDGIDSTGFALAGDVGQTSATRKLTTHWGAVTAFPSTGVLSGDVALRTDVGTGGSQWVYVGPGKGASGWVHKGYITCTSGTRPATALLHDGLTIFETDTKAYGFYDATASKWRMFDTVWQQYTPALPSGMAAGTGGGAMNEGAYMRDGTSCELRTGFVFGTAGQNGGSGQFLIGLPSGLPVSTPGAKAYEVQIPLKAWNRTGNVTGYAQGSHGSTSLQIWGATSTANPVMTQYSGTVPGGGWDAGQNIFIQGNYPIT